MELERFQDNTAEKIVRLSDILLSISHVGFLKERLVLYGGTALNFLYLGVPRLSEDIDLNYRHIDIDKDWGDVRNEVDATIKRVLIDLDYNDDDIAIQASYPLVRFHAKYTTEGGMLDGLKVEIGYMRRVPILSQDDVRTYGHPAKGTTIEIRIPQREELFANKFATMLSRYGTRASARDIYDVWRISKENLDKNLFLDLAAIECLLHDVAPLDFDVDSLVLTKNDMQTLSYLLVEPVDKDKMVSEVTDFVLSVNEQLQKAGAGVMFSSFNENGRLDTSWCKTEKRFNEDLNVHPQLEWLRKNLES